MTKDTTRPETPEAAHAQLQVVLFDMDGVVTDTTPAHVAAWKRLFDAFLSRRAGPGENFTPFDPDGDYREHVDGKPRYDGVRDFLASRSIEIPYGHEDDSPDAETICGLGNRKNRYFGEWLAENRVKAFPGTVAFIESLRTAGLPVAVFSASRNAEAVLRSAGVSHLFDVRVDGVEMAERGLPGKPDPAILVEAARRLGAEPGHVAVVEDATAGIEAGARGGFAPVIGIDRDGQREALERAGAHLVVADLAELSFDRQEGLRLRTLHGLPSSHDRLAEIEAQLAGRKPVVFLDYDGTLTPIVADPEKAVLGEEMRRAVTQLAARVPTAIVSGRELADVRGRVGLDDLFYAGSHGFEMAGPGGWSETVEEAKDFLPELDAARATLEQALSGVAGASVERKAFALAVHYRNADAGDIPLVEQAVEKVGSTRRKLHISRGKMVFDVKPRIAWNKGEAVLSLLARLGGTGGEAIPLYFGDDVTDEDAFRAIADRGIGIVVRDVKDRATSARYALDDVAEVARFLERLAGLLDRR